jgi:hypothetical protein
MEQDKHLLIHCQQITRWLLSLCTLEQADNHTIYTQLNMFKDAVNRYCKQHKLPLECCLEDSWPEAGEGNEEDTPPEGFTWIDYFLRGTTSKAFSPPLGRDSYTSHKDAKGVAHLGEYQTSVCWVGERQLALEQFIRNTLESYEP